MIARWGTVLVLIGLLAAPGAALAGPMGGPDPAARWPGWPYGVTCDELPLSPGLAFEPVAAFRGTTGVETAAAPSELALAHFLRTENRPSMGREDWRRLAEDATVAEFARGRLAGTLNWLRFEFVDGGWRQTGYLEDCTPSSIVAGHQAVGWSLAYDQPRLRPRTRFVRVHIEPSGGCDGGRSRNRHAHPVFRQVGRKLLLSIWLDPVPPGNYTCLGLIEPPLRVKLPGRLGTRVLYDGGRFPPPRAAQTRLRR